MALVAENIVEPMTTDSDTAQPFRNCRIVEPKGVRIEYKISCNEKAPKILERRR